MARPRTTHLYQNVLMDSGRWERFVPRDGDVVVCTAYKAGTTWTQMICALLIHQTPDLPRPLAEMSPWLDMLLSPLDAVLANYDAQPHRRVIKTHTPLDGLPYYDNVTYLYCGRDPRDVFLSMQNHMANLNAVQLASLLIEQGLEPKLPPALSDDVNDRFRLWLTKGTFDWEEDGFPYWSLFNHAMSFWAHRDAPNLHFLHYADLSADLQGQMRRLAGILGVEVDEAKWPALIKAASFADMKANADRTAPNTDHGIWGANSDFFRNGVSGQWRGALSEDSLTFYEDIKAARFPPALTGWLENGSARAGEPKTL